MRVMMQLSKSDRECQSVFDRSLLFNVVMEKHERLQAARRAAGFVTAAEAALALGVPAPTYSAHENGTHGISRKAEMYARFFKVDLNWLLTGKGDMRGRRSAYTIPLRGIVSAGLSALPIDDQPAIDEITLPEPGRISALLVKGDSMYPRYLDGEYLLYDPTPQSPQRLVNSFAVVQTFDGRVMVKQIRPSRKHDHWRLWSHNAPEEDTQLIAAHKIIGSLTV